MDQPESLPSLGPDALIDLSYLTASDWQEHAFDPHRSTKPLSSTESTTQQDLGDMTLDSGSAVMAPLEDSKEQTLGEDDSVIQTDQGSNTIQVSAVDAHKMNDAASEDFSKYRQALEIPSFKSLHRQETVSSENPSSHALAFPGMFSVDGKRVPQKELFSGPQSRALPDAGDPLWKQMLGYCQTWGVLATGVEDDARRNELVGHVTQKMCEAWKFGTTQGHCGQPTGHKSCCTACDNDLRKTQPQRDIRKKPVDFGRQPAPFACDGNKYTFSIINSELENHTITMDQILKRTTPEDLEDGEDLLQDMYSRLERSTFYETDWTIAKAGKFDPRLYPRNLLMFSLWEVQRCRMFIERNVKPALQRATTSKRQARQQERLEIYERRANQHLGLALELNDRRSGESEQEQDSSDADSIVARHSTRSTRRTKPAAVIEVSDDESNVPIRSSDFNADGIITESTDAQPAAGPSKVPGPQTAAQPDIEELRMEDVGIAAQSDINGLETGDVETAVYERSADGHNHSEVSADEYSPSDQHYTHQSVGLISDGDRLPQDARLVEYENSSEASDYDGQDRTRMVSSSNDSSEAEIQDLPEHASSQEGARIANSMGTAPDMFKQQKQEYTRKFWQARIDSLFQQRGLHAPTWPLNGWQCIRSVLEAFNYLPSERNEYFREWRDGLNQWRKDSTRLVASSKPDVDAVSQTGAHLPALSTHVPEPVFTSQLESSRGLSFRYLPSTSQHEQSQVDDMIQDYISYVIKIKAPRFGYYVVFIRPNDLNRKPLAHGVWDLQKRQKVDDAQWFHQNAAQPKGFRAGETPILHDWGYSLPPPARRAKPKTKPVARSHDLDTDYQGDDDGAPLAASRKTRGRQLPQKKRKASKSLVTDNKRTKSATNNKRRRLIGPHGEDDSDYNPHF